VNSSDGVLLLSREAGAFEELASSALEVQPFDVSGTAAMMARALAMAPEERELRAGALSELASSRPPAVWFDEVVAAARHPVHA
jgi:trehalose 6-phosphate synthase